MSPEIGDASFSRSVFTFDQTNGRLVSLNTSAKTLLIELEIDGAGPLTLASVERHLAASGRAMATSAPQAEAHGGTKELHRACRRRDGTTMKMSRIWSPASNTVLIVEIVREEVQNQRRIA